jgi:hypothetical protein
MNPVPRIEVCPVLETPDPERRKDSKNKDLEMEINRACRENKGAIIGESGALERRVVGLAAAL